MKRCFLLFCLMLCAKIASAIIIENFENITKDIWDPNLSDRTGTFFSYDPTRAPLAIVDNPNPSGINTSQKVVRVQIFTTAANSGILRINFTGAVEPVIPYPTCPTCTDEKYDRLRFKYYKGHLLNKNIELEPNGSPSNPKKIVSAQGMDEWEYITLDLENRTYTNFQIRVNRNEDGTGSAIGTNADGMYVYVDDFEFFNSTDGPDFPPETSIPTIDIGKKISCFSDGRNQFQLKANLEKPSNIRIDIISMDGRSELLYNATVDGNLLLPFSVRKKGVYCIRAIIGNRSQETIKIINR